MADGFVQFDEDPIADKRMHTVEKTIGGTVQFETVVVGADADQNYKWHVDANGALYVTIREDVSARGDSGSAPANVSVAGASTVILAAATDRRSVFLTNTEAEGGPTVWLTPGGAVAVVNRGIPLYPGATIVFDKSPNMAITGISSGANAAIAIGLELD